MCPLFVYIDPQGGNNFKYNKTQNTSKESLYLKMQEKETKQTSKKKSPLMYCSVLGCQNFCYDQVQAKLNFTDFYHKSFLWNCSHHRTFVCVCVYVYDKIRFCHIS